MKELKSFRVAWLLVTAFPSAQASDTVTELTAMCTDLALALMRTKLDSQYMSDTARLVERRMVGYYCFNQDYLSTLS